MMQVGLVCRRRASILFSSRRRHTTSLRDWSSDVCSSDLDPARRSALDAGFAACLVELERDRDCGSEPAGDSELLDEPRSEEHTSELQSRRDLVCRLLLEKKKKKKKVMELALVVSSRSEVL